MSNETKPVIDNQQKDPKDWVSGDEPMTGAQASYLQTLCQQTGEAFDASVSKAEASKHIDRLRTAAGLADGQPQNECS